MGGVCLGYSILAVLGLAYVFAGNLQPSGNYLFQNY